jgi:hypothetical protein
MKAASSLAQCNKSGETSAFQQTIALVRQFAMGGTLGRALVWGQAALSVETFEDSGGRPDIRTRERSSMPSQVFAPPRADVAMLPSYL